MHQFQSEAVLDGAQNKTAGTECAHVNTGSYILINDPMRNYFMSHWNPDRPIWHYFLQVWAVQGQNKHSLYARRKENYTTENAIDETW